MTGRRSARCQRHGPDKWVQKLREDIPAGEYREAQSAPGATNAIIEA